MLHVRDAALIRVFSPGILELFGLYLAKFIFWGTFCVIWKLPKLKLHFFKASLSDERKHMNI